MTRRFLCACAFVALASIPAIVELEACGDKFLRLGQSGRHKAYAAVNRASILIYVPGGVNARDVKAFESLLNRAKHRAQSVRDMDALARALRQREYDVVITGISDAARVKAQMAALSSRAEILPVAAKRSNALPADAEREYRFVMDLDGGRLNPLATIDDLIDDRLARERAAASLPR